MAAITASEINYILIYRAKADETAEAIPKHLATLPWPLAVASDSLADARASAEAIEKAVMTFVSQWVRENDAAKILVPYAIYCAGGCKKCLWAANTVAIRTLHQPPSRAHLTITRNHETGQMVARFAALALCGQAACEANVHQLIMEASALMAKDMPIGVLRLNCTTCNKSDTPANPHKRCAGCKVAPYCSTECQRKDWKERHRLVCSAVKK